MSDDRPGLKIWTEIGDGSTLIHQWQCLRCGVEGAWVHMGQTVEGVPGGHLCLGDMKRQMEAVDALVTKLNDALKRKAEGSTEASNLPAGTIVAAGWLAWIKDEVDGWTGICWEELPEEQINEMITSGKAKVLRVGSGG